MKSGDAPDLINRTAMDGGEKQWHNYFRERWIYKKLMVRRTITPVFFSEAAF